MTHTPWEPARRPERTRPPAAAGLTRPAAAAGRPGARPDYRQPADGHRERQSGPGRPGGRPGGAEGNERLTAVTGAVLLVLLAAEGLTILSLRQLLTLHFFIGMLLLGPVVLKAGSTIYRFIRYYTGSAPHRRKGPPAPLLRLLGPVVIASTAGVFGTGVALAVTGPAGRQPWLFLHKASFVIWFCAMTIHVLAYLPRLPRLIAADFRPAAPEGRAAGPTARGAAGHPAAPGYGPPAGYARPDGYGPPGGYARPDGYGPPGGYTSRAAAVLGGRGVRLSLLVASLLAGLLIAVLTVHLAAPWHVAGFSGQ